MAISNITVPMPVSGTPRTPQEAMAQSLAILNAPYDSPLSRIEMVKRLNAVRDLMRGYKIPRGERDDLDYALMSMPLNQPEMSSEAIRLIKTIFREIEPENNPLAPKRDEQGRIISSDNLDLPEPTPEQIMEWETEFGMKWEQ